jgi:hypothetical protein
MSPTIGLPPPDPEICLVTSRVSRFKGGTLIDEHACDLDTHGRRVADPDRCRPGRCLRCGHHLPHVHRYRSDGHAVGQGCRRRCCSSSSGAPRRGAARPGASCRTSSRGSCGGVPTVERGQAGRYGAGVDANSPALRRSPVQTLEVDMRVSFSPCPRSPRPALLPAQGDPPRARLQPARSRSALHALSAVTRQRHGLIAKICDHP